MLKSLLVALSLCADCFAVCLCSGVSLKQVKWGTVLKIALAFAVIHCSFLLAGWALGGLVADYVIRISHILGFILLLFSGGSMIWDGLKKGSEVRNLAAWSGILLGGVATSIDALAVGAAKALANQGWQDFVPLLVMLFAVTVFTVSLALWGGKTIGRRTGPVTVIIGGCVLIGIGISLLL